MRHHLIPAELRFHIEEFDNKGITPIETLAALQHIGPAKAAFDALVRQFPDKKLGLSQGMRIIALNFERPRSVTEKP
jgi:hypothetical protein